MVVRRRTHGALASTALSWKMLTRTTKKGLAAAGPESTTPIKMSQPTDLTTRLTDALRELVNNVRDDVAADSYTKHLETACQDAEDLLEEIDTL